mgnify:CR=1 FL=1
MAQTADKEQFTFQTEIKQLLHLLSHSLYQNREITIRELVSNASDALDKMRFIQLNEEKYRDDADLVIQLEPNSDERTLSIVDNGIGLTHDELVSNLGTIAHSGSLEFLNNLSGDAEADLSLIGQFGVGFYSAFMLADRVEVFTRSYHESSGWRWESEGTGSFSIEPCDDLPRGTRVKLHLKEGHDEFTSEQRLKYIIRKHSSFVPHPIRLGDEQLNEQRAVWTEPKSQLDDEAYEKFYQYLTHRADESPLWHLHLSADSPIQFHTLVYCPATNLESMGFGRVEHGMHLCAKRILVQDDCRELVPDYLRFLYGIVDSADLPLNVSRQALQDDTIFRKIRKVLIKRVLDHLTKMADQEPEKYLEFYRSFGTILREGVSTDFENREKIAGLMRFKSSHTTGEELTSLADYIQRAGEDQTQIYYLGGADLSAIVKNPNLEIFQKKKLEVLYLADPIDEIMLSNLHTFDGKQLTSIDAADVEFPETADEEAADGESKTEEQEDASNTPGFETVVSLFKEALGELVQDVRASKRLTDSPVCLVNPEGAMSTQMQKVLRMTNKDFEMSKRILEINPSAPLIKRLGALSGNIDHSEFIRQCARQLFDNAMLLEGLPPKVEDVVRRTQDFMSELAEKRSPIIT